MLWHIGQPLIRTIARVAHGCSGPDTMFLKVNDWALLCLHKGYEIPASLGVTRKLTRQYFEPFRVIARLGARAASTLRASAQSGTRCRACSGGVGAGRDGERGVALQTCGQLLPD